MWDKFTDQAKRVLTLGREEARRLNHNYFGTEHLLLGILAEGKNAAAQLLNSWGIDLDYVRSKVEELIGRGGGIYLPEITLTPRAKRALLLAYEESKLMGQNYIGPEHILLGLIREGEGVAAKILESLGVSLEKASKDLEFFTGQPESAVKETTTGENRSEPSKTSSFLGLLSNIPNLPKAFWGYSIPETKAYLDTLKMAGQEIVQENERLVQENILLKKKVEELSREIDKVSGNIKIPGFSWLLSEEEIEEAIELGEKMKDNPSIENSWIIIYRRKKIEVLTPFRRLVLASKEAARKYKKLTKEEVREILRDTFLSLIIKVIISEIKTLSEEYYCVIKIDDRVIYPEKTEHQEDTTVSFQKKISFYFPVEEIPRDASINISIIGKNEETLTINLADIK